MSTSGWDRWTARGVEGVRIEVGIRIGVEPRGWRARGGSIRMRGLTGSVG